MPERIKIFGVAAKIQSAEGTDSVPTLSANAVRQVGAPAVLQINHLDEADRSDEQHGGFGDLGFGVPSGRWGQVDITLAAKGAGADYDGTNVPEFDCFLRAAGFSATRSGSAGSGQILYTTFDDGSFEVMSLYLWSARKLYKMIDCIALPKFSAEAGKKGTFTFTVMGRIVSAVTEAAMTSQTFLTSVPPLFHSSAVNIGAFTSASTPPLIMKKIELDFGTAQTARPSAGATDGHGGFAITDRVPTLSSEIEVVPLSAFNPFTLGEQATGGGQGTDTKVSFQIGTTQFNRVKFALGQWAFRVPQVGDSSGIATWPLSGKILARTLASGREMAITVD